MIRTDRQEAGKLLSEKLEHVRGTKAVVLGLARGGMVVAGVIARALNLPLDVLVIKKIPSPASAEFALGALAPDNVQVIHWKVAHRTGADEDYIKTQNAELNDQIKQKIILYRKGRKPLDVRGKTVVVVDDGAATGATIEVAVKWLKQKKAGRIIVALPVAPREIIGKIKPEVSELIVLETPENFSAVGQFYKDFPQVEDEEVVKLLR